ncbi:MAG: tyrosine recombinase [Chloroflexi bacterium]|nr:MAG: tyrosine recombinase [Chloroflexota bacterium]
MEAKIQAFLKFLEVDKGYTANTIAAYQNDLNQFFQYLQSEDAENGITAWSDVSRKVITAYVQRLKDSGDYVSSTIARKVAALKSFFHFLVAEGEIREDPTIALDSPKVKKRLPKAISPEEIERLLEAPASESGPKGQRDSALLAVLYASGMRVTELVSLDISDVKIDEAGRYSVRVRSKKNNSKDRVIPLDPSAAQVLKEYIEKGREQLLVDPNTEALFLNNRGRRLTRQGLWLIIKHYVEAVGISTEVTPHTLRHSFAAHKLSQGKSLQDIQKLLGHANISTTQIYAHLAQEKKKGSH